jgi:hypothetical protein
VIDDPGLAAHSVDDRLSHVPGKLSLAHPGMSAKRDKVVASRSPHANFFLQKPEHQGHGHGASAIGNDGEHTFASEVEAGGRLGYDLAGFVPREQRACVRRHGFEARLSSPVLRLKLNYPTVCD